MPLERIEGGDEGVRISKYWKLSEEEERWLESSGVDLWGAIGQQVEAGDSVVTLGASELNLMATPLAHAGAHILFGSRSEVVDPKSSRPQWLHCIAERGDVDADQCVPQRPLGQIPYH